MKSLKSLFVLFGSMTLLSGTALAQNTQPSGDVNAQIQAAINGFMPNDVTQGKSPQGDACKVEKMFDGGALSTQALNLDTAHEDTDKRWASADVNTGVSNGESLTAFEANANSLDVRMKDTGDEQFVPLLTTSSEVIMNKMSNGQISVEIRRKSSYNLFGWDQDYTCVIGG